VISAAIAAFLLTVPGSEPAKAVESRPSVSGSSPATPHTELSLAVVERLERLSKMSSEERAQALADLPPERRARIEKGLEQLDALSPQQREAWFNRFRRFDVLPQKKKEDVRKVVKELSTLPLARRQALRDELETYRHMPVWAREARMKTADFHSKFNAEEREILHDAALLMHEPAAK
jgi:phage-related protein